MTHYNWNAVCRIAAAAALLCWIPACVYAQAAKLPGFSNVDMVAKDWQYSPGSLVYHVVHAVSKNGSTLDADELKANEAAGGKITTYTADGNVKAVFTDSVNARTYNVNCDLAVFDPKLNKIDLTGNVKIVVISSLTEGPLVQTGTSATIYLGSGPDFPKIDMHQIHAVFAIKQ